MSQFRKFCCIALMVLSLSSGFAHAQVDNATIEQAVKELGGKAGSTAVDIKDAGRFYEKSGNQIEGYGNLYGTGEILPVDLGNAKINDCSSKNLDADLYKRQECEGINFVSQNRSKRPNITVTTKDPIVSDNRVTASKPVPLLEKYGFNLPKNADGSIGTIPASACKPTTVTIDAQYEERICSTFKEGERFLCKQKLIAEVKPHFNYRCNDVSGHNSTEKCSKILKMRCEAGSNNCAQSGIEPTSYDSDMKTTFTPLGGGDYRISYGVIGDQYWGGGSFRTGNFYYRHLKINIKNKSLLTKFILSRVDWDDWIIIRINGHIVFKDAEIEDRLEAVTSRACPRYGLPNTKKSCLQIGPNKYAFAQHYKSWKANPNIDFKDYLQEGENDIFVTVVVSDGGEFYSEWITQMFCPAKCTEAWLNQCTVLEERAK